MLEMEMVEMEMMVMEMVEMEMMGVVEMKMTPNEYDGSADNDDDWL